MPKQDIVVVGASAGGVEALRILASGFPVGLDAAVFVVLHIGTGTDGYSALPEILTKAGPLPSHHPRNGDEIRNRHIYVARPDCHMLLEPGKIRVVDGPKENRTRPAINPLFRSAATAYGSRVTGVILSGLLDDGVAGLAEIKRRGGVAIVQDPSTALFPSMPCNAIQHVDADYITPINEIAGVISKLAVQERSGAEVEEPVKQTLLEQKCPDCSGPLWEQRQGKIVEYRCRIGHVYSPLTLKEVYDEAVEQSLRTAMVTLIESARLEDRLAPELDRDKAQQPQKKRDHAEVIRQLLDHEH
ncbi:MAG TPA: chemotaxis protein CheB [Bryobacteraceae bacterium]|jgi:two-component system chemotaxis response regulator CheB|nr:chemotaxis protein CheB [Bryobacteraceae bacterium]